MSPSAEWQDHLPLTAGNAFPDTAEDAVGKNYGPTVLLCPINSTLI